MRWIARCEYLPEEGEIVESTHIVEGEFQYIQAELVGFGGFAFVFEAPDEEAAEEIARKLFQSAETVYGTPALYGSYQARVVAYDAADTVDL